MTVYKLPFLTACFLIFGVLTPTAFAGAQDQPPIMLEKQKSRSGLQLKEWKDGKPKTEYSTYKVPYSTTLSGARLFVSFESTPNARTALKNSLRDDGFNSIKIEATDTVNYVDDVLDSGGKGMSLIGSARLNGESYKFAATTLYMAPGKGKPRRSEVFIFAAPDPVYKRMGAWSPVSIAWFEANFKGTEHYLTINGNQTPRAQADDLALATELWLEYIAKTMGNITALSILQTGRNVDANCQAMGMEDNATSAC